jgi:uncharacterized protein
VAPRQSGHTLIIDLANIPVHGMMLETDVEPALLQLPQDELVARRIYVQADLTKVLEQVYVKGHISGTVTAPCSRCLEMVDDHFTAEFQVAFMPPGMGGVEDDDEQRDASEELDLYIHDGIRLDLCPLVRDQVVVSFPVQTLCREDCAGLCQVCGGNRNEQPCSCQESSGDPRFAILQRLTMPESS